MRLLDRFDSATAVGEFDSFRPTLFFGVPTIYVRLLGLPADAAVKIGKGMRLFVSGSAPLAAHVFEEFKSKYGHAILERYGMTETFMNISNPYDGERRPGTVGKPLPGVEVRIVSATVMTCLRAKKASSSYAVQTSSPATGGDLMPQPRRFADSWFKTETSGGLVCGRLHHPLRPHG
jgi:malonyl-CoA/methylmalonyl-CoA synthetase